MGIEPKTASFDTEQFFLEFENQRQTGYIKFSDIETDYLEYIE